MKKQKWILGLFACVPLVACAKDLVPTDGVPNTSGEFAHTTDANGLVNTLVDATSNDAWHYLDLETGEAVESSSSTQWDVAFQRFKIITNSGVSGSAGVFAQRVTGASFDDTTRAPDGEWTVDEPDGEVDPDTSADNVFTNGTNDWYAYEETTHILTARTDVFYIVRTHDDGFFKMQMLAYYDDAGTPGYVKFKWKRVDAPLGMLPDAGVNMDGGVPDGSIDNDASIDAGSNAGLEPVPTDALTIDATSREEWTYVRVSDGMTVTISDPATSLDWDLAFQRTIVRTNGGTSGSGMAAVRETQDSAWYADVTTTTEEGFIADELVSSGMPGAEETSQSAILSDWFIYDFMSHTVTPKPVVYIVRAAGGGYAKVKIWNWVDGVFTLAIGPVTVAE